MGNKNLELTFGVLRNGFNRQFIVEITFTKSNKKLLAPIHDLSNYYNKYQVVNIYEADNTIGILLNGVPESCNYLTVYEIIETLNIHQPISFLFDGYETVTERYEYKDTSNIPEEFIDKVVVSVEAIPNIHGYTGFVFVLDCDPPK